VIWVEDPRGLAEALCRHDRLFLVVPDEQYQAWVAALLQPDVRQEGRDGRYRVLLKEGPAPCAAHTGSLLGLTAPRRAAGEFLVALGISTLKADFAIK
jgi:hypothetical protein